LNASGDKTGSGSGSGLLVSGLTNGTQYDVTVVATNAAGTGPASTPAASVTPIDVPGAPKSVSATVESGQTHVSFAAPDDDGGSAVTGYTVTAHLHNAPNTSGDHTGTSSTVSPILVSGLTNGAQYDISG